MIGLEITLEFNKREQGIEVMHTKEYYIDTDNENEEKNNENVEKILSVALNKLPQKVMIDVRVVHEGFSTRGVSRITTHWEQIQLRKLVADRFEVHTEYERKGHWKKRMKDFIKKELNEYKERYNSINEGV